MRSRWLAVWATLVITSAAINVFGTREEVHFVQRRGLLEEGGSHSAPSIDINNNATQVEWLASFKRDQQRDGGGGVKDMGELALAADASCGTGRGPGRKRDLVVVTAGDKFSLEGFVGDPSAAAFDVVVLYYGSAADFHCPFCRAVLKRAGAKWNLVHWLVGLPLWQELSREGYGNVMLLDDDLTFTHCGANKVFAAMRAFDLVMAQPSLCNLPHVFSPYKCLYEMPGSLIHYTNFVEVMAVTFRMDFFQAVVRHTIGLSYFGMGLDTVWPFLLGYPQHAIGVVDTACMEHVRSPPNKDKSASIYAVPTPYGGKAEEEAAVFARYSVPKVFNGHYPAEVGRVTRSDWEQNLLPRAPRKGRGAGSTGTAARGSRAGALHRVAYRVGSRHSRRAGSLVTGVLLVLGVVMLLAPLVMDRLGWGRKEWGRQVRLWQREAC